MPSPFVRLKLTVAYDGRPFRGWQSQRSGDAVQDRIEQAFAQLCEQRVIVQGAGRTDAGVHALAQIAHADVPRDRLLMAQWAPALNAHLPREIRVLKISLPGPSFHARFDARGKIYLYRIWNDPILHPLEIGRAWHLPGPLNMPDLTAAAVLFQGTHDFAGFAANRRHAKRGTIRSIRRISVQQRGRVITLRVDGDGFLYKMVRLITGTLVRCAQGRTSPQSVTEILRLKGALKTSFAAPAEGLYLQRVRY